MRSAISNEVPGWVVNALGEYVELVQPVDEFKPGQRGLLCAIDAGIDSDGVGAWRGQSEAYAIVAFNESDLSDLSNVPFEAMRRLPLYR